MSYPALPVRLATSALRVRAAREIALRLSASRQVALVLVYHRVGPDGPMPHEVVPTLSSALFSQHVAILTRLGDIVPIAQLLESPRRSQRPRFCVTFDDDHAGHVEHTLPILQAAGVHATFFLSGRALHGLSAYWWTFLEESIRSKGLEQTARALGLAASTPAELASQLEGSASSERLQERLPASIESPMSRDDMHRLASAGMTIGFHTLLHLRVSDLSGADLDKAMNVGKRELADAVGHDVDVMAYPYGRASRQAADAAERAGFRAAFVSGGHPVSHLSDPFLLGRWDPGALPPDEFAAAVSLRLLRSQTPPRGARGSSQ